MRKIDRIAEQIRSLSQEEFAELRARFLEQDWKLWDVEIEAEAKAAKLHKFVLEAKAE